MCEVSLSTNFNKFCNIPKLLNTNYYIYHVSFSVVLTLFLNLSILNTPTATTHFLSGEKTRSNLEGQKLDVLLHRRVVPSTADEPLGVEDRVLRVGGELVLGCIPDETLSFGSEGHIRRRDAVALIVRDDLHAAILEHPDAGGKTEPKESALRSPPQPGRPRPNPPFHKSHLPGVGGPQVDADHRAHVLFLILLLGPRRAEQQQHRSHQGELHLAGAVGPVSQQARRTSQAIQPQAEARERTEITDLRETGPAVRRRSGQNEGQIQEAGRGAYSSHSRNP